MASTSAPEDAARRADDGITDPGTVKKARTEVALYSYWRSSSSYRVRIALNLKGISYAYKAVHLLKDGGHQFREDYVKLNPMREVPTLVIDGHTLTQSTSIIEYLEETRPEPRLLPGDAYKRAVVRQIMNIISNDIQPIGNLRVLQHVMGFFEDKAEKAAKKMEWARHYIDAGFRGLEEVLKTSAGKYSVGDEVTMADVYVVPQVYNANRFNVDMSAYPSIARVNVALMELPEFKAAAPGAQPDAEPE